MIYSAATLYTEFTEDSPTVTLPIATDSYRLLVPAVPLGVALSNDPRSSEIRHSVRKPGDSANDRITDRHSLAD